jgi:Kip1 ubiquitination-promoting complex protein 1
MRALEMIISITPNIFDDGRSNSDIILGRICQLLCQVLTRIALPPSCFQHVIDLCLPDLSSVTYFAIFSAAIGILLALMKDELDDCDDITRIPKISRYLLTDTSFQISTLEYALGERKTPINAVKKEIPRGNFDPKIPSPYKTVDKELVPEVPIIKFNLQDCEC